MNVRRWARNSGTVLVGVAIFVASARFADRRDVLAQSGSAETKMDVPAATTPTVRVTSRETAVDVTVTDKQGNPVHGLTQADFMVKEDSKPQPIRSFHEYRSHAIPEPKKLPPNVYTNLQPPAASSAVNILLLDFTNAAPVIALGCCDQPLSFLGPSSLSRSMERQRHIKQYAMQYLQSMPVGTLVAVLGASHPSTLRVLQGVTSDPALLSAAISTMKYDTDANVWLTIGNVRAVDQNLESWCSQQSVRNRMTLESLDQIAADAVGIKGRKNLLWFTTGIPSITDPNYGPAPLSGRPRCLPDYSTDLKKAYGLLAAAQVTVFPISVRGVPVARDPIGESWPDEQPSLEAVAEATGGTAYYNSNDLKAGITKAIESGSDYYTLTYIPPGTEYDGKHHTIHLEANRPDLHLTYRKEYYAEDSSKIKPTVGLTLTTAAPDVANSDMKAAMSRSMPTSIQILFDVRAAPTKVDVKTDAPSVMGMLDPRLKGKPLTRYDFDYSIPARQITFTDGPNGTHHGSLELDIAVYDTEAKLVSSLSQTVNLPLSDERYKQFITGPFRFPQQIDLPSGQLFVRIGVLDKTSNKVGTLEIPLTVAKGQK